MKRQLRQVLERDGKMAIPIPIGIGTIPIPVGIEGTHKLVTELQISISFEHDMLQNDKKEFFSRCTMSN